MKWLSLTLLLFASAAQGEGGSFQLHLFSHHEGKGEYNEVNLGAGYVGPASNGLTYTVGFYENSFSSNTFYAGGVWRINRVASIFAAAASGYEERQFIGGLMLRAFPKSDFAPTVTLAPGAKGLVMMFGVDYRH